MGLADADGGNVYKLWNKDATMGCECDAGYFGPDCSQRSCKVGVDPLYLDDTSSIKYSIFDFAVLTTDTGTDPASYAAGSGNIFDDGTPLQGKGQWAIKFYDHSGEDWVTEPIDAGANCAAVTAALEGLPNDVIPADSLECIQTTRRAVSDNLFVNDRSGVSSQESPVPDGSDYKITYRMSIWDAYIYKKFGTNFQDVLSIKTKLGNQVYSPLLWLPGSMTQPFSATDHEAMFNYVPLNSNSGLGLKVVDASGNHATGFVGIAAQAAGAGVFKLGDTTAGGGGDNALTTDQAGMFVDGAVVTVTGVSCAAAGIYTIGATLTAGTTTDLAVDEAIPAQLANDDCYVQMKTRTDLGTGSQMIPVALTSDLGLDTTTPFAGTGINRVEAAAAGGIDLYATGPASASTAKITLASALATTSADYHKIVANTKIEVKGSDCTNRGVYTVTNRKFDGTNIYVWEDWTSGSPDLTANVVAGVGKCTINLYNANLPT